MTANSPEAWSERSHINESWSAALWSEFGQTQRFLAALRHLDLRDGDTLLDYGAGSGRFCEFLPQGITYYAYDWAEGMRERVRRDHPRAWVLDEMPDREFDHIVCIGPFNLAEGWSKTETWDCIDALCSLTVRSLVVSLYTGNDPDCLSYSPEEVVRQSPDARFAIDCTYLANDLMLVLRP